MKNLMPAIRGRRICKGKFGVLLFLTDLHYKKIDKERLCMYNNHKIVLNLILSDFHCRSAGKSKKTSYLHRAAENTKVIS